MFLWLLTFYQTGPNGLFIFLKCSIWFYNQRFNKIKDLIADNFEVDKDKITENTSFMNDLDADSIDLVEFILQLEDEFGAEIPDDEAEKIKTVGDAVSYIKSHQG